MKKNELIEAIRQTGMEVNTRLPKEELEAIYDKLHVHKETEQPEVKPDEPEVKPDEPEVKPDESEVKPDEPEVKPDIGQAVTDEFEELAGKISGAEAPKAKKISERPLITKERKKRKKGESSPDSFRVEGYVLLLITDTIFPFGLAFINNMLDKKLKIQASDIKLSEKDFNELEPLADQAADYLAVQINPIAGFFLVAGFMYAGNLLTQRELKK